MTTRRLAIGAMIGALAMIDIAGAGGARAEQ